MFQKSRKGYTSEGQPEFSYMVKDQPVVSVCTDLATSEEFGAKQQILRREAAYRRWTLVIGKQR